MIIFYLLPQNETCFISTNHPPEFFFAKPPAFVAGKSALHIFVRILHGQAAPSYIVQLMGQADTLGTAFQAP